MKKQRSQDSYRFPHQNHSNHPQVKNTGLGVVTQMAFGGSPELVHSLIQGLTGQRGHSYAQNNVNSKSPFQEDNGPYFQNNPCFEPMKQFQDCLKENESDISICQIHYNHFLQCRRPNNI